MLWFFKDMCDKEEYKAMMTDLKADLIVDSSKEDYALLYDDVIFVWNFTEAFNNFDERDLNGLPIRGTPFRDGAIYYNGEIILNDLCYIIPIFNNKEKTGKHDCSGYAFIKREQYIGWFQNKTSKNDIFSLFPGAIVVDNVKNLNEIKDEILILKNDRKLHKAKLEAKTYSTIGINGNIGVAWSQAILRFEGQAYYSATARENPEEINCFVTASII